MYEPLPPSNHEWLTKLGAAIKAANDAHEACTAATLVQERLAIDRTLQLRMKQLENSLVPNEFINNQSIQTALTRLRTTLAARLMNAGASLQIPGEPVTTLSQIIALLPEMEAQKLMDALL